MNIEIRPAFALNIHSSVRPFSKFAGVAWSIGLLIVCLVPIVLRAEPPPGPPLVGTAPDQSAWTIDVQQKNARKPPSDPRLAAAFARAADAYSRMVRVSVEKSGGDRHEETVWENGKKGTIWIHEGWVIFQPSSWPADKAMAVPVNHRLSPVKGGIKSDFADLDWVRPEVFVGSVSYEGHQCYYFEDKQAPPLTGGDTMTVQAKGARAWIDAKTRLPIAVEDAAVLKKYSYRPSAVTLQLPGVFATAYQNAVLAANRAK